MRLKSIDVLRCIAVLLVSGCHFFENDHNRVLWRVGWCGVDLFFVLSGFLVSGLLFSEYKRYGEIKPGRFFIRRGLKIYPAFYFFTGATIFLWMLRHPWTPPRERLLAELLFVQNYVQGLSEHTWSLAVEEHFYFAVALLIFAGWTYASTDRQFKRWMLGAGTLVLVVVPVLRILTRLHLLSGDTYFATHLRLDSLMSGVLFSCLYHFHYERLRSAVTRVLPILPFVTLACTSLTLFYAWDDIMMATIGYTLLYIGFVCLLAFVLFYDFTRIPSGLARVVERPLNAMAGIGAFSYSIYLWHNWSINLAWGYSPYRPQDWLGLMIALPLVVAVGWIAARVIEYPVLRMRDRFFPSRSEPIQTPSSEPCRASSLPLVSPVSGVS